MASGSDPPPNGLELVGNQPNLNVGQVGDGHHSENGATPSLLQGSVPFPPRMETRNGQLSESWKKWRQVWESFEVVSGLKTQPSSYRVATFITCIGPEALEIYNALPFREEGDSKEIDIVLELMEQHCIGQTNVIYDRYVFNNRNQSQDENIDQYITALRALAKTCQFGALHEELLRDRVVCGVRDTAVRKRLLQEPKLTLQKCLDICRAAETTAKQVESMEKKEAVHQIRKQKQREKPTSKKFKPKHKQMNDKKLCSFCGSAHPPGKNNCKAWGAKCNAFDCRYQFTKWCSEKSKAHTVDQFL